MQAEQWQTVWRIFDAACNLPAENRRAYVQFAGDAETASEVLAMLDHYEGAESATDASDLPPAERPQPGDTIGRYRITGTLGSGGMGDVYAAEDLELGRRGAMKFVAHTQHGVSRMVERFIREARAASALNHPNVVTVHEVVRAGLSLAIVMELVDGEPLRARCGSPQPAELVASWGRQIAAALAAAHERGIVHRDIKPENLMLRGDGYVKVLDFGLARELSNGGLSTVTGLPPGTLRYMSPEQAVGGAVTEASDIFSLGVVLYELAAGKHPFDAASPLEVAHKIATQPAAPPSSANPAIPLEFDALIQAMLSKNADGRPGAVEMERFLHGPWQSMPAGGRPPLATKTPRKPALISVALVLVGCGLAGWFAMSRRIGTHGPPPVWPLLRVTPLTDSPGSESQPAFSPDGSQVAYVWDGGAGGNRRIRVRMADGRAVGLSGSDGSPGSDDFDPAWSPDGREIAFLRRSGPSLEVMIAPASGGAAEREAGTIAAVAPAAKWRLAWAGSAELIVADRKPEDPEELGLFRMDVRTGEKRPITVAPAGSSDLSPALSPDRRRLSFLRSHGGAFELYGLDLDVNLRAAEREPRLIVKSGVPINSIAWLPDNQRLLYSSGPSIPNELWRVSFSGGAPEHPEFTLLGPAREMAIPPKGGQLAYVRPLTDSNIWSLSLDPPSHPRRVTTSPREDLDVSISPNGSLMAYAAWTGGDPEIWIAPPKDISARRQLTFLRGAATSPAWSPDGATIAFDYRKSREFDHRGNGTVWLINSNGGQPRRLLDETADSFYPIWSIDGTYVYYCSSRTGTLQIWRKQVNGGGSPEPVTTTGGIEGHESLDGRYFYWVKQDGTFWRKPMMDSAEERIPEITGFGSSRFWDLRSKGIYFVNLQEPVLKLFSFDTRRVSVLANIPARLGTPADLYRRGLSVAPDGRSALYSQFDGARTEIVVARIP